MTEFAPPTTTKSEILAGFHRLFREKYSIADQASFFLETQARVSGINITITNQRDALSHFVTFLRTDEMSVEAAREQLVDAEEHLRRAIVEPYEVAVALEARYGAQLRDAYLAEVATLADPRVANLPTAKDLAQRADALQELRVTARKAKARNIWDPAWEAGVKTYIETFVGLRDLSREMEEHLALARRIRAENADKDRLQEYVRQRDRWIALAALVAALISVLTLFWSKR
jgi:hypothetical protein